MHGWRAGVLVVLLVTGAGVAGCHARLAPVPLLPPTGSFAGGDHEPTISVTAEPMSVAPGERVALTSTAYDADNDALTIRWTAPSGTFNNPTGGATYWTAPAAAGTVTITVKADDSRGGVGTATVTVQVK